MWGEASSLEQGRSTYELTLSGTVVFLTSTSLRRRLTCYFINSTAVNIRSHSIASCDRSLCGSATEILAENVISHQFCFFLGDGEYGAVLLGEGGDGLLMHVTLPLLNKGPSGLAAQFRPAQLGPEVIFPPPFIPLPAGYRVIAFYSMQGFVAAS